MNASGQWRAQLRTKRRRASANNIPSNETIAASRACLYPARMIAHSSIGKLAIFAGAFFVLEGCAGSLSQPFDAAKTSNAQITVYRLQNFEPPAQAATAAGPLQIPAQVTQWATAVAGMLPPGLIPPGILPGSAPAAPDASVSRFHDFR